MTRISSAHCSLAPVARLGAEVEYGRDWLQRRNALGYVDGLLSRFPRRPCRPRIDDCRRLPDPRRRNLAKNI